MIVKEAILAEHEKIKKANDAIAASKIELRVLDTYARATFPAGAEGALVQGEDMDYEAFLVYAGRVPAAPVELRSPLVEARDAKDAADLDAKAAATPTE